ncbi:LysE family translocator [Raoultella sp. T31]|uniref:LysE family translocator n=1 Tax=Raoultella sp. T31 TaxID=2054594 RepID=UPI000C283BED|nr:LysE family translocator [Raoultella sp. T31]
MNYALMAGYSMTVLALIATPGPVVLLVTGCAARDGSSSALRTMIGSNLASLVLMAVAAAMLSGAVAIHPDVLLLLAALGSIYITWLALSMLRAPYITPGAAPARGGVLSGFATALSNPKDILFFVAFFPQFIQITSDVGLSLGLLSIIWVVIDLAVLSFYILAIRRWLAPAYTSRLTTIAAWFLLTLGLYGVGYHFWLLAIR